MVFFHLNQQYRLQKEKVIAIFSFEKHIMKVGLIIVDTPW